MDTGSDSNSYYRIEPTVFNSNASSNADSDANSGINYNANSTTKSKDACKAST